MINYKLINKATEVAKNTIKSLGSYESDKELSRRALNWYSNTEIVDIETLAAVILRGDFEPSIKINEIEFTRDFYKPILKMD